MAHLGKKRIRGARAARKRAGCCCAAHTDHAAPALLCRDAAVRELAEAAGVAVHSPVSHTLYVSCHRAVLAMPIPASCFDQRHMIGAGCYANRAVMALAAVQRATHSHVPGCILSIDRTPSSCWLAMAASRRSRCSRSPNWWTRVGCCGGVGGMHVVGGEVVLAQ
jgi:hypothetical protein